jgi:uncharacterized membrane protein
MGIQTGGILVRVSDDQGAPLPGAAVSVKGHMEETNAQGECQFFDLSPGSYTVEAQLEGFSPAQKPATVDPGENTPVGLTLSPSIGG